jgi:ATP-dependent RNA helicase SUPV3L1/SUV3
MVFESMHKYNGKEEVPLSVSQVKQIAGRAGRFGLHETSAGGIVTTLRPDDLPILKTILPGALPSVPRAVMDPTFERVERLASLLEADQSYSFILQSFAELARLPQACVFSDISGRLQLAEQLTPFAKDLSLQDLELFSYAPVNVRDDNVVSIFRGYIRDYAAVGKVNVEGALKDTGLLDDLEMVGRVRDTMPDVPAHGLIMPSALLTPISAPIVATLPRLESLHKALVLYIWLSFRYDLAFSERSKAMDIKERTEELLEFCLERLPGIKQSKKILHRRAKGLLQRELVSAPAAVERERALKWMTRNDVADWRTATRFGNVDVMEGH